MFPVFNPCSREKAGDLNHLEELLAALDTVFLCIIKLDLNTGKSWLLQSAGITRAEQRPIDWNEYLDFYSGLLGPLEMQKFREFLALPHLRELRKLEETQYKLDLNCREDLALGSFQVTVSLPYGAGGSSVYVLTRQSEANPLLQHIINLYVYNSCDYFIYLDARHNSYVMFGSNQSGTPLPPVVCSDYSAELVKYAYNYVVPEDQEMVIREMQLERVQSVLEKQEVHTFFCGMLEKGNYTRKRVEFRYYDRENQMILLTRTDITDVYNEQLRQNQRLNDALQRALTDPLTGLLNYQGIRERVAEALEDSGQTAALLFLDLDDFKSVNDTHGHARGDQALLEVAGVLKCSIRQTDFAARIGGDEFVIYLGGLRGEEEAAHCAQRICDEVNGLHPAGDEMYLSCSIGVAIAPRDGATYDELVKKADKRVYRSKADGKNQVTV